MRQGVTPSRVFLPPGDWPTALDFLRERFPHLSGQLLRERMQRGDIVDSQARPLDATAAYRPGQWLWYYREVKDETSVPFSLDVIFQDERLVVVDKPHFLATTPGGRHVRETALARLRDQLKAPGLTPMHRLDRDTAGLVMFCINPQDRGAYQSLFQRRAVHRSYEAIAPWRPQWSLPHIHESRLAAIGQGDFRMQEVPGPSNSRTRIELIAELPGGRAHYRLLPSTGRKHQLRVHMSALGVPIENDEMYPVLLPERAPDDFSRPLQLLARTIWFEDPFLRKVHRFESRRRLGALDAGQES